MPTRSTKSSSDGKKSAKGDPSPEPRTARTRSTRAHHSPAAQAPADDPKSAAEKKPVAPARPPLSQRVRLSLIDGDEPEITMVERTVTGEPSPADSTPAPAPAQPEPQAAPRRKVLPPISRIRERQKEPPRPPTPAPKPPEEAPRPEEEPQPQAIAEPAIAPADVAASEAQADVVHDEEPPAGTLQLKSAITVKDLADLLKLKPFQVIRDLMDLKIFPGNHNSPIEVDVALEVCAKHGFKVEVVKRAKGEGVHKPPQPAPPPPKPEQPVQADVVLSRAPIITFMGHVDHGKTSLMDAVRKTRVAAGEAGGITQHIGAYSVEWNKHRFTFLDTPGHEAFTAMRARGAQVTDIVVLVVAADDGIMPQTAEAINHAKAAGVTILVAINKIDLPGANVDRVLRQLQERDLAPEEWGGQTVCCQVSATKGTGIDHLLDMLALQSEMLELKADPTSNPRCTVIESQIEAGRGPTATVIVQVGTLHRGQAFLCGNHDGRIRTMLDDRGAQIKEAGPSTPVKILGFSGLPAAGDELVVMESEKAARTLAEQRQLDARQEKLAPPQRATLENLLSATQDGQPKVLRVVLKTDVHGSLEAVAQSIQQIRSAKVELHLLHGAVGPISESDVLLASASNAVVIGFNTKVEPAAASSAKREGVQIKLYSIIYELIDQVKDAMTGLLEPELRESVIGRAIVKRVFDLSRGKVAGCVVSEGRISRAGRARVLRGRQPLYDGGVATLRRFQDDVKEVRLGLECGIRLGEFDDYEPDDIIECYLLEKIPQKL